MIGHTKAYVRFREQGIELYDHCVLVCFALPLLDSAIAPLTGSVSGKIPPPVHFKNPTMTAEQLKKRLAKSGDILGKELLLSTFAYFEAYVVDAIQEIIEFHSGRAQLVKLCRTDVSESEASSLAVAKESKRKLQEYPIGSLKQKYQKHAKILRSAQFPFPSRRLAAYGWQQLCAIADKLNAAKIPDVLKDALLFPMSDRDVSTYHQLKDKRNKIAHGGLTRYSITAAIKHGSWLRELAVTIDKFIVETFLIIELPADALNI